MTTTTSNRGIVLFAHGSRDPLWHKPIEAVARQIVQTQSDATVVCAYLELSTPSLPTAVAEMVQRGIHAITIVPLFLGVGKHAREDLPLLVATLRQTHPEVAFTLQPAVGEDPRLISLLAQVALGQ